MTSALLAAKAVSAETFLRKYICLYLDEAYSLKIQDWNFISWPSRECYSKVSSFLAITLKIQQNPENTCLEIWESLQWVLPGGICLFGRSSWKTEEFFLSGEKGSGEDSFQEKVKSNCVKEFENAAKYG